MPNQDDVWSVYYGDDDSWTSFEGTEAECRAFFAKFGEEPVSVINEFFPADHASLHSGPYPWSPTVDSWSEDDDGNE